MKYIGKYNDTSAYINAKISNECFVGWITNGSGYGKIVYINDNLTSIYNESGKIENIEFLSFTADGVASTISLTNHGGNAPVIYYSFDKDKLLDEWDTWDYNSISLDAGLSVYMYGNNPNGFNQSYEDCSNFVMSGKISASGNILSLISLNCPNTIHEFSYGYMFIGCSSLTSAPELPATTLADGCYYGMFSGCSSLTTAPELPATTLADGCYLEMFIACFSLTTAPELPATTLALNCYCWMFNGCTSLTTAPELPATTLANNCYNEMFRYCSKLNYVKCLATTNINTTNLSNWLSGVASTGTFVKASSATYPTSTSGIPSGWTIQNI